MTGGPPNSSDGPARRKSQFADAAQRINEELFRRPAEPMQLDPNAIARLEQEHAEFLGDVGQDAIRIARAAGVRTVDESHVVQARARLGTRSENTVWLAVATSSLAIGGLVGGLAASSAYAINFSPGPHTPVESTVAIILAVVATVLLTFGVVVTVLRARS